MTTNELVKKLRDQGKDIIALGFGQSPFPPPDGLVKRLQQYASKNEYLHVQGYLPLRREIAEYYSQRDNRTLAADDIVIGPGTKELQFLLQMALKNYKVFVPVPCWVSYSSHCKILNKKIRPLYTRFLDKWAIQTSKLTKIAKDKGHCLLIVNSPNNPNGIVYSDSLLQEVVQTLGQDEKEDHSLVLLLDEIYSELTYDNNYTSLAKYMPTQSIISSGISKFLGADGWRLGYLVFPPQLKELRKTVVALASETYCCTCGPVQYACCGLFQEEEYQVYLEKSRKILKALSHYCCDLITEKRIRFHKPMGGWYLFLEFVLILNKLYDNGIQNSQELSNRLFEDIKVSTTPGSNFLLINENISLRLCLVDFDGAKALEDCPVEITEVWLETYCPRVIEGIKRLSNWINNITKN
jgi:aspartate aminotransferase